MGPLVLYSCVCGPLPHLSIQSEILPIKYLLSGFLSDSPELCPLVSCPSGDQKCSPYRPLVLYSCTSRPDDTFLTPVSGTNPSNIVTQHSVVNALQKTQSAMGKS